MIECKYCGKKFQKGDIIFECNDCNDNKPLCKKCKEKHKNDYEIDNSTFKEYTYDEYIEEKTIRAL